VKPLACFKDDAVGDYWDETLDRSRRPLSTLMLPAVVRGLLHQVAVGQAVRVDPVVARRHEGDHLVVVEMDDRIDVGPQAQDLAVHLVADGGGALAGQDAAIGNVGDDKVVGLDFLEADALGLGVAHAVGMVGMRDADHHAADAAVDQPAIGDPVGVGDVVLHHPRVERHARIGRQLVDAIGKGGAAIHHDRAPIRA
jgi:hypothetical protein